MTNDGSAGTNFSYIIESSDTNSDSAKTWALGVLGSVVAAFDIARDGISSLAQTVPSGSEPDMNVSWGSGTFAYTIDLNPVHKFPWAFVFSHALLSWILVVTFLRKVLETLFEILSDYASAQTGSVPNLQGGSGSSSTGRPMTES